VVDENNFLIGIVTDRDIRSIMPSIRLHTEIYEKELNKISTLTIKHIMTKEPVTLTLSQTLQDALLIIEGARVGALPVVDDDGKLKGIISVRDLLRAFVNVLGIGIPGTLICVIAEEKLGQMKKIVDAITEENISIGSILVARHWDENKRAVFPYLLTQNIGAIKKKLADLGFTPLDPMEWYVDTLPKNE
jgi:acetoin utilization protein AcuB